MGEDRQTGGDDRARIRRRYELSGRVQGVGFRPYIYRLATDQQLAGHVGNSPAGAFIEVEGPVDEVERFGPRIAAERPPLMEISDQYQRDLPLLGELEFRIVVSSDEGKRGAEIAPDTAVCADCLRELRDPADRRHRYPFTNCTNCGPRYSIIQGLPYDRPLTTMSRFPLCPDCKREYEDPADRRFHAQPNACPVCGPRVVLRDAAGRDLPGDPIREAARLLREGSILAIKGLGGFHLACRADLEASVAELRRRKDREAKPLAIMLASLAEAEACVDLDEHSRRALTGPAHPIVLAPRRRAQDSGAVTPDGGRGVQGPGAGRKADVPDDGGRGDSASIRNIVIADSVAPGSHTLGVMLPYTPLHELLLAERPGPLLMTSGNPSAEPLCTDNDEALRRLGGIADYFLLHDRDIERRVDDSVVMGVALPGDSSASRIIPLRRARGYAPATLRLESGASLPILAVGGELKSTVCLLRGRDAVLSEHLGDLDNPAAYRNFLGTVAQFERLLSIEPELLACDLHPDYASTRYARGRGLPICEVQHHHAHIVSCLADNGLSGDVLGLACDGTGYGTDGAIWGCEIMACDERDFRRVGQLRYFPLLGGDAAARDTWRPAAGLCREALGEDWRDLAPFGGRVEDEALRLTDARLSAGAAVPTSSLGRLFDAVAFLLGVCERNRCEAEAPMALESLAAGWGDGGAGPLDFGLSAGADGLELDWRPLVRDLLARRRAGRPGGEIALDFHESLALMLAEGTARAARETGLKRVVLSGGSFANRLLLTRLWALLRERGLDVYIHHRVPPGDGGLALGQACCAAARAADRGRFA